MRSVKAQKDFIFILILWNICITQGNVKDHFRFWLGCQAVIPCSNPGLDSFKWFYKKEEYSDQIMLLSKDKKGVTRFDNFYTKRLNLKNTNLVISSFTDDDQGMYWCEICHQRNCSRKESNIISVKKEILDESQRTVYILAGTSFKQECSGNFSSFEWVFEASHAAPFRKTPRPYSVTVTSNKSIYIPNVNITDAGKYTCLVSRCGGPKQKVLTVNLCVITAVNPDKGSPVLCSVVCDEDFNKKSHVWSEMMNITGILMHVDGSGKLTCNASQMFKADEHSTVTSSYVSTTAFSKTTGMSTEKEDWSGLVCGVLVPSACLILILMFCLRKRLQSAFPLLCTCCVFRRWTSVEEESSIVYSSIAFRTPAKTRGRELAHNETIYGEIKFTKSSLERLSM